MLIIALRRILTIPSVEQLTRYRIGILIKEGVLDTVVERFQIALRKILKRVQKETDVDRLDKILTALYREVSLVTIGYISSPGIRRKLGGTTYSDDDLYERLDIDTAIRLYKRAKRISNKNRLVLPIPSAVERGNTAIIELERIFTERYIVLPGSLFPSRLAYTIPFVLIADNVAAEIIRQDGNRAYGRDGIHIKIIKVLYRIDLPILLYQLFNQYAKRGTIPRRQNTSDIYLLAKDEKKPKDAQNLRPIAIIYMFQKVFKKLVLIRYVSEAQVVLHPCQAGFRSDYSIYTNATIVYYLLASGLVRSAVFLDLRLAFDIVSYDRLLYLLRGRGYPPRIYNLIYSLTFEGLGSRVIVNGEASAQIPRLRGVL